jgi:hypothetical protein
MKIFKPDNSNKQSFPVSNYFLVVSAAIFLDVSAAILLVSAAILEESTVTAAVSTVLVESAVVVEVDAPPPQAVRAVATTITKSTFFMF